MLKLCFLIVWIIMATALGWPISSEQSYPLSDEPLRIDKENVTDSGLNSTNYDSLSKLVTSVGGVADMMSRYERIIKNKERELEQKRTSDQKKQLTVPKKPEEVRNCSIIITTPISLKSYQVKEAAEKFSNTFTVPCLPISKFLAALKKKAPLPDNFKPTKDEPICAIHAFKLDQMRHKNIPCERLVELVNTYEPQPGQLNCTQEINFNHAAMFTPCTLVPTDKDYETSFTVLAIGKRPKVISTADVPKISEEITLPASGSSVNSTIKEPAVKQPVDEFDFDTESLEERTFNLNVTLNTVTLVSISAEE